MTSRSTHTTTGHSTDALWGDPQAAGQIQPPDKPFVPLSARKRPVPPASLGALTTFRDVVQPWHAELGSKAVETAHAELQKTLVLAESAKDAMTSIPAEQRAEDAQVTSAAREDADSGERRAPIARTDWVAETAYREQRWALAHDAVAKASSRYRAVVSSEAPRVIPSLIAKAAKAREAARPALLKAEVAIARATAATSAVFAADHALGLQSNGWHEWPAEDRKIRDAVSIGVGHLLRWIDAAEDSELLSGHYVLDTSANVPEHTIRALAEGNEFAIQYVLPNVLHAQGRAGEIRDPAFVPDPDFREVHLNTKRLPR